MIHRLAFGLEPRDAVGGGRVPPPLLVLRDGPVPGERELRHLTATGATTAGGLARLDRHDSTRHALLYGTVSPDDVPGHVDVRLVETTSPRPPRRFVPRRLRLPLVDADAADARPTGFRVRRPRLFPGAAYPLPSGACGLRGRVLRGGEPARWARVQALASDGGAVLVRAHGDDRGEFLLVLGPPARPAGDLAETVTVQVRVFVADPPPAPDAPGVPGADPLWDLPLEEVVEGDGDDPVTLGEALPDGYDASVTRSVEIPLGRILTAVDPFEP